MKPTNQDLLLALQMRSLAIDMALRARPTPTSEDDNDADKRKWLAANFAKYMKLALDDVQFAYKVMTQLSEDSSSSQPHP